MRHDLWVICGGFCEEWKLVSTNFNQIQVKQIIFEGFWRITSKQNRENRGKKEVIIFPWNALNSVPLSFLPLKPFLFWWIISVNFYVCLFLTRYFAEKLKNKASLEGQHQPLHKVTLKCRVPMLIDLVTVFDAILTSRQTWEKLQCLYENLMSNNFRRMAVLNKMSIVN